MVLRRLLLALRGLHQVPEGRGDYNDFDEWEEGNKAPWGLYMHAAWFFGDYYWHYEGYTKFLRAEGTIMTSTSGRRVTRLPGVSTCTLHGSSETTTGITRATPSS